MYSDIDICLSPDPDIDEDNELNCPQIIRHSSYYDSEKHIYNITSM